MTKRRDDDENAARIFGAGAVGGPGLAGAVVLGGLLGEERSRSRDLGPAPIGSDPWLLTEVRRAIARERDVDASNVTIDVREAIVTLAGEVDDEDDAARVETAARSVKGIKRLVVQLRLAPDCR